MPGKAAKITITERQQEILRTICNAPTAPSQLQQRASIILLAFDGLSNPEIAAQVGVSSRQVGLWRRRWAKAWDRLIQIECTQTHAAFRRAVEKVLSDEPRPGAPASSPRSRSPRSWRSPASPPRCPAGPSPTGRPLSWPPRSSNGESWCRSPRLRWVAISVRPSCGPTRASIGSTPPRRTRCDTKGKSMGSATPTMNRPRWRGSTGLTRSAPTR